MKKYISIFVASFCFCVLNLCADSVHIIEKGETLYSLSKKYQLTVAELRTANNLSENDVIKVGQKIIIPDADIGTAAALVKKNSPSKETVNTAQTVLYTVEKGETLYGIARKNNMSVADLMQLNNLDSSSVIKAGQKLKIVKNQPQKSTATVTSQKPENNASVATKTPDTRNYGVTITADSSTKWPVSNPKITQVKGKVSGVQLSAKTNESVNCIHEGTVMYVGVYRGFGQVVFVQSKTGLIYAYTGLGSVDVKKGDYAVSGTKLGTAGIDSISGNSQITFMVFQNGQPIDPAKAPRN